MNKKTLDCNRNGGGFYKEDYSGEIVEGETEE